MKTEYLAAEHPVLSVVTGNILDMTTASASRL